MKLPQNNKPTLKDLFDSKKLDQPSDKFWDDFQDQVRSKTLSSVVTESSKFSINQFVIYSSCLLVLCSVSFFGFYKFNVGNVDTLAEQNAPFTSLEPNSESNEKALIYEDLELFSSLNAESNNVFDNDTNLFVEQSFHISSLETTFQHRILVPTVVNKEDSAIQFTF
jgi:hypothetical protein